MHSELTVNERRKPRAPSQQQSATTAVMNGARFPADGGRFLHFRACADRTGARTRNPPSRFLLGARVVRAIRNAAQQATGTHRCYSIGRARVLFGVLEPGITCAACRVCVCVWVGRCPRADQSRKQRNRPSAIGARETLKGIVFRRALGGTAERARYGRALSAKREGAVWPYTATAPHQHDRGCLCGGERGERASER